MTPKALTVVFRADAAAEIGGGHIVRCLALATTLASEGWQVSFASRLGTEDTVPALTASDFPVICLNGEDEDEPNSLREALRDGVDWLIVDHYQRDARFEDACRPWARRVLVLDDLADRPHKVDLLLDVTPGRAKNAYDSLVPAGSHLLLGSKYALLRREFCDARDASLARRATSSVTRVLISLGATDASNATGLVLEGIAHANLDIAVDVVLGACAPHAEAVAALAESMPQTVTIYREVKNMAELMTDADIAIGAPGGAAWERCCLGLPSLLITTAPNQDCNAAALDAIGAAQHLGGQMALTPEAIAAALKNLVRDLTKRQTMTRTGAALCDGLGARRLLLCLAPERTRDDRPIYLRPATMTDAAIMMEWQSHPDTRRFARTVEIPEHDQHEQWMQDKLADPDCLFNVILHEDRPAGVIRLDRKMGSAIPFYEVSILVAPEAKGLGLASGALALGRRLVPEERLVADVLPSNTASLALFKKVGFQDAEPPYTFAASPLVEETP